MNQISQPIGQLHCIKRPATAALRTDSLMNCEKCGNKQQNSKKNNHRAFISVIQNGFTLVWKDESHSYY